MNRIKENFSKFARNRIALVGAIIFLLVIFTAIFSPQITPFDPNRQDFGMISPPSTSHVLGTDDLGRDLLSRLISGARISLIVAFSAVSLALVVGVTLGLLAGYYGGLVDMLVMRYIDLQWSLPNLVIAVGLMAVFGRGLINIILAISVAWFDDFARITRGEVLGIREVDYVSAARSLGGSDGRILIRHILPNSIAPIIVQATICLAWGILAEASLSYLGLGVNPSTPTWGLILSDARGFFSFAWWLAVFPGVAIMITTLSVNFLGDGLRDFFDVREIKKEE
ncbi:ABC transporter permease [Candidatus Bipolaricaulota bacterium]|nr:ABC transporter permease [Candidatus Bipolaricaulota bacterium]